MSILDIIQIAVTVFAVCVFIFSAHVSRKTRRFEQELENRRSIHIKSRSDT